MIEELNEKNLPESCWVFKHSTRCPISSKAAEAVKQSEGKLDRPLYWVNVVEQRDLSNWIEEHYEIKHHSPQLLLIDEGRVAGDWTHGSIEVSLFE